MKALTAGADLDAFLRSLRSAPSRVLLVDYDGTLAPFHVERDRVFPYPEVLDVLRDIQGDGQTRLVVVSGRMLDDLRPLIDLEPSPELWGTHGWERERPGRRAERVDPGDVLSAALALAVELAERLAPSGRVEAKPASVAVHLRGLTEAEGERLLREIRVAWESILEANALELREFDGGAELRVPGRDKGSVIREILSEEPPGAAVAYLGDDLTDEDAFRALQGHGLSVLVRGDLRPTAAEIWIRPPAELVAFLRRWRAETSSPPLGTGTSAQG